MFPQTGIVPNMNVRQIDAPFITIKSPWNAFFIHSWHCTTFLQCRHFLDVCILFSIFQFEDFKNYAVTASLMDNPKLERSIALFNGLSQWVQCMVLCKTTPQQRADVIVKFVNVARVSICQFFFFSKTCFWRQCLNATKNSRSKKVLSHKRCNKH